MEGALTPTVRIYPTIEAQSRAGAEGLIYFASRVLQRKAQFAVALSGGRTPRLLYQILASDYMDRIPWNRVHLYWGDERYVHQRDAQSNFHMFHEALLQGVEIPLGNVHPMPTHRRDPDDAALDYERFMRSQFDGPWPELDVVMLGMGADGHTASLFPRSEAVEEMTRWVVASEAPVEPISRLTFTLPVLNAATDVCFLVSGEEKADMVNRVLTGPVDARECPASAVRPAQGQLIWWLDEAAASKIEVSKVRDFRIERFEDSPDG